MKTQRECHQALCEGKTLIQRDGTKVKFDDKGDMVACFAIGVSWSRESYTFKHPELWEIYEEPKPSASYEEAVAAKKVLIHWPPETYYRSPGECTKGEGWSPLQLMDFDLAARRHYRMEVVE